MEYKLIFPKYKKWFRILHSIPIIFVCIFLIFWCLHISYKLNRQINSYLAMVIILVISVSVVLNYLYAKIYLFLTSKWSVGIYQNFIQLRLFFFKTRITFSEIKNIGILNKENTPRGAWLFFDVKNIKGIKIISKKTFWHRGFLFLYNIDNFDKFIEELKGKLPYHLIQNIN